MTVDHAVRNDLLDGVEWLHGLGMSQADIAAMLGTSEQTVSSWRNKNSGTFGNRNTRSSAQAFLVLLMHLKRTAGVEWIRGIRGYTPMMWIELAINRGLLK